VIREHNERYWLLVVAAIWVGVLAIVPSDFFNYRPPSVRVVNQLPGGVEVFGIILIVIGSACLIARAMHSKAMRVVHACSAGYYVLLCVVLSISMLNGEWYTGLTVPYMAIMSWLHYRAGIESEPLGGGDRYGKSS
jgi:hypothetical protein